MQNVVAAFNSSIPFNKHNFWIDPKTKNQYFVGVQYPENDIKSIETLLDIPITTQRPDVPKQPIPLRNVVATRAARPCRPRSLTTNIQPTIDLTMGVYGRDLGHVSDDVAKVLDEFGKPHATDGNLAALRPDDSKEQGGLPGLEDRAQRRVPADAGYLQQPGRRPDPGLAADLLPDGRPGQVVRRAADGHVDRAALPGRHPADALLHRLGGQRAVAAGLHLHRRHQGGQHGADDRLRPGAAAARGPDADPGDPQGGHRCASGRSR